MAAALEEQLSSHVSKAWEDFCCRFTQERLNHLSEGYKATWQSAIASFENFALPESAEVSQDTLAQWSAFLKSEGKSASTIRSYLKHLRASLSWGKSVGLVQTVPSLKPAQPDRGGKRKSRGRAITPREFARMLRATRVTPDGQRWREYLKGIWWSGFRLRESLQLGWEMHWPLSVDISREYPVVRIFEQKSGEEQVLPLMPEFAAWLKKQPDKTGPVFKLPYRDPDKVGKTISQIGRLSGVVVSRTGKHASLHDLRRSFGSRWARRLMPAELQQVMRHKDIKTTMAYYVDIRSDDLARKIYSS